MEAWMQLLHALFQANIVQMPGGSVYYKMYVINLALLLKPLCGNLGFQVFAFRFKL
jgi:hypothetical protein